MVNKQWTWFLLWIIEQKTEKNKQENVSRHNQKEEEEKNLININGLIYNIYLLVYFSNPHMISIFN